MQERTSVPASLLADATRVGMESGVHYHTLTGRQLV